MFNGRFCLKKGSTAKRKYSTWILQQGSDLLWVTGSLREFKGRNLGILSTALCIALCQHYRALVPKVGAQCHPRNISMQAQGSYS